MLGEHFSYSIASREEEYRILNTVYFVGSIVEKVSDAASSMAAPRLQSREASSIAREEKSHSKTTKVKATKNY